MATLRQIRAASDNARQNTGPRSPGGAGNARTHGLTASRCLSEHEQQLIADRFAELKSLLQPEGQLQLDEVFAIATSSIRLERCQLEEEDWRLHRSERAEFYWDADLQLETVKLAARLPRSPALTAPKLRQTLRGCRWMLEEFHDLARRIRGTSATVSLRPLDENGRRRAFDLLGLNEDRRVGPTPLDPPGAAASDAVVAAHQAALIAAQIAELEGLVGEDRVALDESIRIATINGAAPGIDNQTRLIRRYETEARRVKERAHARLKELQDEAKVLKEQARTREMEKLVIAQVRAMHSAKLAAQEATAAQPVSPPAAPEKPVAAAQPTPAPVRLDTSSIIEEALAEAATMRDPNVLPISITEPLSRRQQKAAARAAHRAVS